MRKALANLDEAAEYIAHDNRSAARVMMAEAFRLTDLLAGNPNLGKPGRVPGTRELKHAPSSLPNPSSDSRRLRGSAALFHGGRQWPEVWRWV